MNDLAVLHAKCKPFPLPAPDARRKATAPRAKSSRGKAAARQVPAGWGDALGAGGSSPPSPCQGTTHASLQKPF